MNGMMREPQLRLRFFFLYLVIYGAKFQGTRAEFQEMGAEFHRKSENSRANPESHGKGARIHG
ncbi:hypothetical protein CEY16_12815 [Halalkalibacillus sediminis]|uniref:Uncharacterized protein n=1 Tax=Halalkalibacillus sediminis TaxID=2018042 RepID=A0A2I0QQT3_9BACI|nr:hypothetical protein CEY16_12815 [Halalkalibacillus sediminis]